MHKRVVSRTLRFTIDDLCTLSSNPSRVDRRERLIYQCTSFHELFYGKITKEQCKGINGIFSYYGCGMGIVMAIIHQSESATTGQNLRYRGIGPTSEISTDHM